MTDTVHEIRALLAPMTGSAVLLPNNVVAEVVAYAQPKPIDKSPPWLLGRLEWNDWQVPVVSFAALAGTSAGDPITANSRILIFKSLSESTGIMYLGMVINGLPKLTTLTPANMEIIEAAPASSSVFSLVRVADEEAMIPELAEISGLVEQAMYSP